MIGRGPLVVPEDLPKGSKVKHRGMHSEVDLLFQEYATWRWLIRAALSIPVLLLVVGGASRAMDRAPGIEDRGAPDRRLLAGRTPSDGASPSSGPECGWNSMKPYLESLLKDVGGPEGVGLGGDTMNPTQNGIGLTPRSTTDD